MRALRKMAPGRGNVELVDVPEPEPRDDEVLIKVWANGICGSDLLIEDDKHFYRAPVTLGHEYGGVVKRVGAGVTRVRAGDRVAADIETRDGWLGVTRDGGCAPYMVAPEAQVYAYPPHVPLDHVCLTEPVVAIIHALQERNRVRPGDFVTVVGPGPMGLLGVQFAKLCGARAVALVGLRSDEGRLEIGRKVGADHILYSEERPDEAVMDATGGRGADVVLECSASGRGLQHAIDCARRAPEGRGGRGAISVISLWGEPMTINFDAVSLNQISIHGAWSWDGAETWERAVELIARGVLDLDSLITGRYALEEWRTAFRALRAKRDVKAFIQPNGTAWAGP